MLSYPCKMFTRRLVPAPKAADFQHSAVINKHITIKKSAVQMLSIQPKYSEMKLF